MNKSLSYDDVLLVPHYSELESRELADTSVDLCGFKFKLPVCPANMQDVIDVKMAKYLSENGYFYIYHRFGSVIWTNKEEGLIRELTSFTFVEKANTENWKLISISTGVNLDSLVDLQKIQKRNYRVDFITIDVAHGHHSKVRARIKWIKENLPNTKVIAGNVATHEACESLISWGADVVKVGIGQGSICTTRFQTGFSIPMFSCIKEIVEIKKRVYKSEFGLFESISNPITKPIIADGGVKYIGDIPKALVAGATMIMSGKLFASCIDSPAQIIDGHKQYRGSTSFAAKKHNKHIEGKVVDLEADITFAERLQEIKEALQSSISYAGGNNLDSFKSVNYIEI